MALKLADVLLYLGADQSGLDRDLNSAEQKTSGWASKLGGGLTKLVGGAVVGGAVVAAGAIVGVAQQGISSFIGFQDQMNEVFTLLPGISQQAMDKMTGQVKSLSKEMGVLPEDVVPALYQALSAGVPPDNVFEFLKTSQKAAKGGVTELETAVDGISSVVNAYGSNVLDAAKASDLMFTAVKLGKTNFEDLSRNLFNVIPTAASLKVNFGEVTAALSTLTAQGTPTSVATTQMRQLLVELSQAGGKAAKTFQEMSGQTFADFVAGGGTVEQALAVMSQAAQENGLRLSDMFSSVEAGNAALGLTGNGAAKFASDLAEMGQAAGATDTAYNQMQTGVSASLDKIKAQWAVTVLDVGTKLAPAFSKLADLIVAVMPTIGDVVARVFDGVVAAIDWSVNFIQGLFTGPLQETISGGVGYFAYFKEWVDTNLPLVQNLVQTVLGAIQAFWEKNGAAIMDIVRITFTTIGTIIDTALKTIMDLVTVVLQLLNGDFEGAAKTYVGIFERLWDTIKTIFSAALSSLRTLVMEIDWAGLGLAIIRGIGNGIMGAQAFLYNVLKEAVLGAWNAALNAVGLGSESGGRAALAGRGGGIRDVGQNAITAIGGRALDRLVPAVGGLAAVAGGGGNVFNITINNTFNGPADVGVVEKGTESGIVAAMRSLGLR